MRNKEIAFLMSLLVMLVSLAGILGRMWIEPVRIEYQLIPTIINGLVSSVSLILVATVAFVTFSISRSSAGSKSVPFGKVAAILWFSLSPVFILLLAYTRLLIGDYNGAFKVALSSFIISLMVLLVNVTLLLFKILPLVAKNTTLRKSEVPTN